LAKYKLNLAGIVGKYVGIPYALGGNGSSGIDCLMLVNSIGRELGASIPDEFKGVSEDDYAKLWTESPEKAKHIFISYVSSLGERIDVPFLFPPDLVLFRDGEDELGVGVYVGKGLILSAFVEEETRLVNREGYPIEAVIRWVVKHV
jgi:cell wall-associated NlpC family hydrolase